MEGTYSTWSRTCRVVVGPENVTVGVKSYPLPPFVISTETTFVVVPLTVPSLALVIATIGSRYSDGKVIPGGSSSSGTVRTLEKGGNLHLQSFHEVVQLFQMNL